MGQVHTQSANKNMTPKNFTLDKSTFLCLDAPGAVEQCLDIFGSKIQEITVADPVLKERGIKWVRFEESGKDFFVSV